MNNYQSDSLTSLIPALIKAQSKLEVAEKSKKAGSGAAGSRSYKYADWPAIVGASRKALQESDLCVAQRLITTETGSLILSTLLLHKSGEFLDSRIALVLPPNANPQAIGSCITYFKRYAYASLIGVVADDEDDDAGRAEQSHREYTTTYKQPVAQKPSAKVVLSDRELAVLEYELKDAPELIDSILRRYEIGELKEIPVGAYSATLERIREIKRNKGTN